MHRSEGCYCEHDDDVGGSRKTDILLTYLLTYLKLTDVFRVIHGLISVSFIGLKYSSDYHTRVHFLKLDKNKNDTGSTTLLRQKSYQCMHNKQYVSHH